MLSKLRERLTYANVMSTIACCLAVGTGGAYAANTIGSADIIDESIVSADLKNYGVKRADIGLNSINAARLEDGTITNPDIGLNAVTSAKVLDNTLTGADITESSLAKVPAATTADGLGPPEAWHAVAAGSTTEDRCADPAVTAVFCSLSFGLASVSWTNFGGGHATAAFYKDQLGIVHLRGLVTGAAFNYENATRTSIFRLPASYRPTALRVFASVGAWTPDKEVLVGRIDVSPNGLVDLVSDCFGDFTSCSAHNSHITLDGVAFRPDE